MAGINGILLNLNSGYEQVTDLISDLYYFTDDYSRYVGGTYSESEDDVEALAVQSDGRYLMGFHDGLRIIRRNADGSLDGSFSAPSFDGFSRIRKIIVQTNGKIILLGDFQIGPSYNIARLNSDGSLDSSFNVGTGFDSSVEDGFISSDGIKLIVRGSFSNYDGVAVKQLASIQTSDGALTSGFQEGLGTDADGGVNAILLKDGWIYADVGTEGGYAVRRFTLLGVMDGDYSSQVNVNSANFIVNQSGKLLVKRDSVISRLNSDGTNDNSFSSPAFDGSGGEMVVVVGGDGSIYLGGMFSGVGGVSRHKLCKLSADGELMNFADPFDFEETVVCMAFSGTFLLVGGRFNKPGRKLVKLDSSGALVPGHSVAFDGKYIGISDGGDDIWDGGNFMDTDLTQTYSILTGNGEGVSRNYDLSIPNTHTPANDDDSYDPESAFGYAYKPTVLDGVVMDGSEYFGEGSSYFTQMYPGMYAMVATGVDVSEFSVTGNSGTDGDGEVTVQSFEVVKGATTYSVFRRSVHGDDPSNNGLIIVKGPLSSFSYQYDDSSDRDDNSVSGLSVTDVVYYIMISRGNSEGAGAPFTNEMAVQVASAFLDVIGGPVSYTYDFSPQVVRQVGEGSMDTGVVMEEGVRRSLQRTGYFELVNSEGGRKIVGVNDGETVTDDVQVPDIAPNPTGHPFVSSSGSTC